MRKSNHEALRKLLRNQPDGLTVSEAGAAIDATAGHVRAALQAMPDAYIDRWVHKNQGTPFAAVWCVVTPPANCPHPTDA